jgi:hypothetical protein
VFNTHRLSTTVPAVPRAGVRRFLPTRRQVKWFFVTFLVVWMLGSGGAMAADMAQAADPQPLKCVSDHSCKETKTLQAGELIPIRDMSEGGNKTLFESYSFGHWILAYDMERTFADAGPRLMDDVSNLLMLLLLLVVYMTIGLTWWLFGSTSVPGLTDATDSLISGASGTLLEWVFPTALALGAVVAYAQGKQARGSWFGQLAWMVAAGVLAVGLTTNTAVFTTGIDKVRTTGSDMILSVTGDAISGNGQYPLKWNEVDYSVNTSKDAALRKTGDAIWRDFAATPWCLAQFGSIQACQKYGKTMLKAEATNDARSDVIKDTVYPTEGNGDRGAGKDTETGQWVKGENWGPRLGIVLLSLASALVFCVLMLVIGFSALAGVVLTAMLLLAGVFFAALWVIPGLPRRWGVAWAETLVGAIMITFMALLTFSATTVLVAAVFIAAASAGWFVSLGLIIMVVITAFSLRKHLLQIVGTQGSGIGRSFLAGAAITRMATRGLSSGARGASRGARGATSGLVRAGRGAVGGVDRTARAATSAGSYMRKGMRRIARRPEPAPSGGGNQTSGDGVVPPLPATRQPVKFSASRDGRSVRRTTRQGPAYTKADRGKSARELGRKGYQSRTGRQPQASRTSPQFRAAPSSQNRQAQLRQAQTRVPSQPTPRPQARTQSPAPTPAARPRPRIDRGER